MGFVGADIDAHTYEEFLVPFLCRMTSEMVRKRAVSESLNTNERFASG